MRNIDSNLIVFLFLLPPSLHIEINIIVILRNLDFSFSLSLFIYMCVCIFFLFFILDERIVRFIFFFFFFATIYPRRLERLYTVLLTVIIRNRSELSRDLLILARTPLSKSSSRTFVRRLSKERVEIKKHTGSGSGRVINEGIYRSISNTFATKLGTESFRTFPC